MRAALIVLAVGIVAAVGVDALGDLTQTRSDPVAPDSRTAVVVDVEARYPPNRLGQAAQGLWWACQGIARREVLPPGLVAQGGSRFTAVVRPALGEHARARLRGCLEDATVDRVRGRVVSMRDR